MSVAEGFFPDAIRCIDLFTAGVYGYCNLCMFRDEKEVTMNNLELQKTANEVRKGIIIGTHAAGAGHPGGSLSAADIFTYLYFEEMNIDPQNPKDPDRDRFVLSKGHTAPGLYSAMANRGYFPVEELETLRKVGARLQGHPSMQYLPGLDMGDGEIEEGQVWEAAMFAAAKKLDNLVVIVDNNNLQIDGTIEEVNSPYPIDKKFEAFNFHVININGNDFDDLRKAFAEAKATKGVPTAIIAKTVKGKGVSFMENQVGWHGKAPNDEQFATAMEDLAKIDKALEAQA